MSVAVAPAFIGKPDAAPDIPPEPQGSEDPPAAVLWRHSPMTDSEGKLASKSRQSLRAAILTQRRQLSPQQRQLAARSINQYIVNTTWFQNSQSIAFYIATRGEIDPSSLLQLAWEMGKICYLPVCHPLDSEPLWFIRHNPGEALTQNRYGILEPKLNPNNRCEPDKLDIAIVPIVGFDAQGNRLGSGKGYYDKTFAHLQRHLLHQKPQLIGLAYSFQEVAQLHAQAWDIPVNQVVAFDLETEQIKIILETAVGHGC